MPPQLAPGEKRRQATTSFLESEMQSDDRAAIEGLFGRLSQVQAQAPQRDGEAEAFINERVAAQPAAPYYMAQTIVVQEQALAHLQARIEELEADAQQQQSAGGGLFGGLFGGGAPARPQRPAGPRPVAPGRAGPPHMGAQPGQQPQGGGFLAGAAQTAVGVAGGMLVAGALSDMFAGGEAQAAEPSADEFPADEPAADEGGDGFDMFGGGDEEF